MNATASVSADGKHWSFELHSGVRFVDDPCFPGGRGRELGATDVKASIERGITGAAVDLGAAFLPGVLGIDAFLAGESDGIEGIRPRGPTTIEIELRDPSPTLLHFLARPPCFVVAPEAIERYAESLRVRPVGTGPFRLVSWNRNGVILVRRRDYWRVDDDGRPMPYLDAVRFVPPHGNFTQYRLYLQGRLDHFVSWYFGPSGETLPEANVIGAVRHAEHYYVPWWNAIYFRVDFRSRHPLVRDPRLRRALSLAALRQVPEIHLAAKGLLPPGFPGHDSEAPGQRTDLERARLQLAKFSIDLNQFSLNNKVATEEI